MGMSRTLEDSYDDEWSGRLEIINTLTKDEKIEYYKGIIESLKENTANDKKRINELEKSLRTQVQPLKDETKRYRELLGNYINTVEVFTNGLISANTAAVKNAREIK